MDGRFRYPWIALIPFDYFRNCFTFFYIIGYQARLSAGILAAFCLITAFIFHYDFTNQMETISFLKNLGLSGGFLFIVANGTRDWSIQRKKKYVRL